MAKTVLIRIDEAVYQEIEEKMQERCEESV